MTRADRLSVAGLAFLAMAAGQSVLTGPSAFSDYTRQKPGVIRRITVADLPAPCANPSVDRGPILVRRPTNAWPQTLPGFQVTAYATELDNPRLIRRAPNGDLFVAESAPGRIKVVRGTRPDGTAARVEVFATDLTKPFGIAFYPPGPNPQFVYVANTDSVVRFPYQNGDRKARGPKQSITGLPGGGLLRDGGHWTRDIAFSLDGKKMFVSVGSRSNVRGTDFNPTEYRRADILEFNPDGSNLRVFAYGVRNPVGIAIHPLTGELWTSVNERDELGDNLVPDYITHVQAGGFYGWPWYYMGGSQDPRHKGRHPELKSKVITPDVLLQPHNASLELTFYDSKQFPSEYHGDIFAAQHGSWNKAVRTGYEVIRVPLKNGRATGEYEDFLTGFVTADGSVWGRPVGVAVADDGALLVSDDGAQTIWRVAYVGAKRHGNPGAAR
jgi:glucose/arabinose dehydrogenase